MPRWEDKVLNAVKEARSHVELVREDVLIVLHKLIAADALFSSDLMLLGELAVKGDNVGSILAKDGILALREGGVVGDLDELLVAVEGSELNRLSVTLVLDATSV